MTMLLMASAESSSRGGSPATIIAIAVLIVAFDIAMVFSAWQKGTLFNNIIKSLYNIRMIIPVNLWNNLLYSTPKTAFSIIVVILCRTNQK